jgi:hypothetical protein
VVTIGPEAFQPVGNGLPHPALTQFDAVALAVVGDANRPGTALSRRGSGAHGNLRVARSRTKAALECAERFLQRRVEEREHLVAELLLYCARRAKSTVPLYTPGGKPRWAASEKTTVQFSVPDRFQARPDAVRV